MGFIFKDADEESLNPKIQRLWAASFYVIIGVLALVGIAALVLLVHDEVGSGFRMPRQIAMGLLSAAIVCGGLIVLLFGIRAKKEAIRLSEAKTDNDDQPWLNRPDWATEWIAIKAKKPVVILWIFVFLWFATSIGISLGVAVPQHNPGIRDGLLLLVLLTWVAVIFFAMRTTIGWRRFGRSVFQMASLPAPLGGALQGQIQVQGKAVPQHGWHLVLSCVRRSITGPTNNLKTTEKTLWRDEKWLQPNLPQSGSDVTSLPVFFKLPADKPESTPSTGDGTHWLLEAWARFPGPDFQAKFEIPVFRLPETPAVPEDPTAPHHVSLDEIRKQIQSQIRIVDLPDGKEFIFPAGRTPGFVAGALALCVIWAAIVGFLVWKRAPLPLPLVFGAMDLLMLSFVFDLWFRHNQVRISAAGIRIETGWLSFKKDTVMKLSEGLNFFTEIGAPVGHQTYYDLKLRARDGNELLLAKNLGHKPEAEWLAQQMNQAARNFSTTDATRESQNQKSPAAKK